MKKNNHLISLPKNLLLIFVLLCIWFVTFSQINPNETNEYRITSVEDYQNFVQSNAGFDLSQDDINDYIERLNLIAIDNASNNEISRNGGCYFDYSKVARDQVSVGNTNIQGFVLKTHRNFSRFPVFGDYIPGNTDITITDVSGTRGLYFTPEYDPEIIDGLVQAALFEPSLTDSNEVVLSTSLSVTKMDDSIFAIQNKTGQYIFDNQKSRTFIQDNSDSHDFRIIKGGPDFLFGFDLKLYFNLEYDTLPVFYGGDSIPVRKDVIYLSEYQFSTPYWIFDFATLNIPELLDSLTVNIDMNAAAGGPEISHVNSARFHILDNFSVYFYISARNLGCLRISISENRVEWLTGKNSNFELIWPDGSPYLGEEIIGQHDLDLNDYPYIYPSK